MTKCVHRVAEVVTLIRTDNILRSILISSDVDKLNKMLSSKRIDCTVIANVISTLNNVHLSNEMIRYLFDLGYIEIDFELMSLLAATKKSYNWFADTDTITSSVRDLISKVMLHYCDNWNNRNKTTLIYMIRLLKSVTNINSIVRILGTLEENTPYTSKDVVFFMTSTWLNVEELNDVDVVNNIIKMIYVNNGPQSLIDFIVKNSPNDEGIISTPDVNKLNAEPKPNDYVSLFEDDI